MRVPQSWLSELVEVKLSPEALNDRLELTGTAVAAIHRTGESLENVVIGRIVDKTPHPQADKLWVTLVDIGESEPVQIVCGAQNFEVSDLVPVALPGAVLPAGMKIKRAKLRGVESAGMNCSAAELGLGSDQDGLLILPKDAPIGSRFSEYQGLSDVTFELEVTPNRADCMSMVGVAREVAAVTGVPFSAPSFSVVEEGSPIADVVDVTVVDSSLCPRYAARLVRGVKIGPSPKWLADRLIAAGARPVNNIVDITNYVMFEMGQPLHAFDLATLRGTDLQAQIIVRRASAGELLQTLDGVERRLDSQMLVIADSAQAIALAGVMGGASTEVSETTVDVLLEAAVFDKDSVSRTSRSLGLLSEASSRFERGVDPAGCVAALDRAASLLREVCGGVVASGVIDVASTAPSVRTLELRIQRLCKIVGEEISAEDMIDILQRLGLRVEDDAQESLRVEIPSFRPDLEREIDLVEEVLRIWGMERVKPTLPSGTGRSGGLTRAQADRERVGATLRAAGLTEAMTYIFAEGRDTAIPGCDSIPKEEWVRLMNPMSEEQASLRRHIFPGLLRSVSFNQNRGVSGVHLYEIGTVFATAAGRQLPREHHVVAGVLNGRWMPKSWHDARAQSSAPKSHAGSAGRTADALDFFDGKGVIETLLLDLGVEAASFIASQYEWLQPGRSARVVAGSDVLGWLGEVHPEVLGIYECEGPVVAFELSLDRLLANTVSVKRYRDVPRFPPVQLDIALVVDSTVTASSVETAILESAGRDLHMIELFDVYTGEGVESGKKSLAYSLTYRSIDRTLTDDEVKTQHERMLRKVEAKVGARLRG